MTYTICLVFDGAKLPLFEVCIPISEIKNVNDAVQMEWVHCKLLEGVTHGHKTTATR